MKRFLVIDDSSAVRKVTCRLLEALSFQPVDAEDGPKALAICEQQMPDAILLDGSMPEMDGHDVLRRLRQLPEGAKPIILFSLSEQEVGQIARAMRAGATDHILKPYDADSFRAKLEEVGLI